MERPPESLKPDDERPEWQSFRRAWRAAARRPPRLAPGDAARRVLARLEPRPRRHPLLRWAAAAALAGLALVVSWLVSSDRHPRVTRDPAGEELSIPLDDGVVLLWLDAETPLYLTLVPPTARAEKQGASS